MEFLNQKDMGSKGVCSRMGGLMLLGSKGVCSSFQRRRERVHLMVDPLMIVEDFKTAGFLMIAEEKGRRKSVEVRD